MSNRIRVGQTLLAAAVCPLLLAIAVTANAQSVVNQPTTTTLWAGTADFNTFGLSDITSPSSGVILQGTAISTITGKPVRHMWYGDSSNGLCRVDPEVDDPGTPAGQGLGSHHNIIHTCIGTIQKTAFVPGQLAFDPINNIIYATNIARTNSGVIRLHYVPNGDSGQGLIDPVHVEVLMGTQTGRNAAGGCPPVGDPTKPGNPPGAQPDVASIGPDGNLYVGYRRSGLIVRFLSPATLNPASPSDCQNKIQVPLFSADQRVGTGHTFGLGWIGETLFGADNIAPWILPNADQCLTPANGNQRCGPTAATEILATQVPGPQGGLISDAIYPTYPGNTIYAASTSVVTKIANVLNGTNMTMSLNYGGVFCFVTGLIADTNDLANEPLYVGADCTQGSINGAAAIYQVMPQAPAPGPPGVPVNVTAVAGDKQATVSWNPTPNAQPITSYVVQALVGGVSAGISINVGPGSTGVVPTSAMLNGLTDGVTYTFDVQACNGNGCSAFSAQSNAVTPQALTVPSIPLNVSATAGNASSTVAWSAPASNGGSPVTSYTVTPLVGGSPSGTPVTVPATSTGTNVAGLVNGTTYTFTVHATNSVGNSAESAPSNAVTPFVANQADIAVAMSSPASINAGSLLTFAMTVTNNGPGNAAKVTLSDTLPATLSSSTTSQGACSAAGASFSCNLGGLAAGASATVSVTVLIGSANVTNSATVAGFDSTGTAIPDPAPANNTASATTTVNAGGGGGGGGGSVSTDIQVVGSAQNGGPNVNSSDTFTWQIKDNQGKVDAPGVVFTLPLPSSFQFGSVTASQGSCGGVSPGTFGGTITCSLGTVPGGQTAIVTVNFTPTQSGSIGATGSATFNGSDTNSANNLFTVTLNVR